MDTKAYFKKIRTLEQQIEARDAVIVSLDTPAGGKSGVVMEAPRYLACKLVVEEKARLATPEEASKFQNEKRAAYQLAVGQIESSGGDANISSAHTLKNLRGSGRPTR